MNFLKQNGMKYKLKDGIIIYGGSKISLSIIDYKITLYECKNGHKIENILLD